MKQRIGIVGGGQLARMLVFDAKKMGFHVTVLDPTPFSPGGQVADEQIVADLDDEKAMQQLVQKSDYITIEWELANAQLLEKFAKKDVPVNPNSRTLAIIKDKFIQKQFLKKNGIPVADFLPITSKKDILAAGETFGYPLLLKARMDAYDGRGNAFVKNEKSIDEAMEKLHGRQLYVEKFVPFTKEISVMIARSIPGEIKAYSVVENIHKNNILHITIAPGRVTKQITKRAQSLAKKTMTYLKGAGVFGIEMFVIRSASSGQAQVLVNEIAPRVHNSGHYTIESCFTSQFEQHIRAVTGLPLGDTRMHNTSAVMVNILGERNGIAQLNGLEKAVNIPGVTVHIYGKKETRMERKMGHLVALAKTTNSALANALKARKYLSI